MKEESNKQTSIIDRTMEWTSEGMWEHRLHPFRYDLVWRKFTEKQLKVMDLTIWLWDLVIVIHDSFNLNISNLFIRCT